MSTNVTPELLEPVNKNIEYGGAENKSSQDTFTAGLSKQLEGLGCTLADYDFLIVSDGSGYYKDSIGGAVCAIVSLTGDLDACEPEFVLQAQTGTTTSRMELQAFLNGLNRIQQHTLYYPGCQVLWVADTKSTVDTVNGDAGSKANSDMWLLFDYYAKDMLVKAVFTSRDNLILLHNLCDLHSSNLRELMINYVNESTNFKI